MSSSPSSSGSNAIKEWAASLKAAESEGKAGNAAKKCKLGNGKEQTVAVVTLSSFFNKQTDLKPKPKPSTPMPQPVTPNTRPSYGFTSPPSAAASPVAPPLLTPERRGRVSFEGEVPEGLALEDRLLVDDAQKVEPATLSEVVEGMKGLLDDVAPSPAPSGFLASETEAEPPLLRPQSPKVPTPTPLPGPEEPRMVHSLEDCFSWASDFHDRLSEAGSG